MKLLSLLAALTAIATLHAADWPGYRGPNQDGIYTETANLKWPATGPKAIWKVPTKNGFSSFAVAGGKAFTQVVRDIGGAPREICLALDAATGKELWAADVAVGKGYSGGGDGDGPRSTPTINDGIVYVFTPDLVLHALHAGTGKPLWDVNLLRDHAGRNIAWNNAASPVVDGDLVFIGGGGPGQSLLAINKKTGKVAWKTGTEIITHAMPVVATILGERQVIYFCKSGLVSLRVNDGKELWKFPYPFSTSTAASPIVSGDIVYCSAGYGVGGGACRIAKQGAGFTATPLWQIPGNKEVANHWSTPICRNGYLYGMFSFKDYGKGPLKCVELATGKVQWEQPGFGAGNVTLVNDKLLALSDKGELVLVDPVPAAYKEIARAKVVDGKCWSTPTFSNGRIYIRSTKEGVCLDPTGK